MKKEDKKGLIKAYNITIEDFEIALRHCEWYEFRRSRELRKKTEYFRDKLVSLYEN